MLIVYHSYYQYLEYINFLKEVIKAQASLVAKWQTVGFIHGVMNTDNMTISGETIDYGPCAFMDTYNPDTVFSSIDTSGGYSYKNQPKMLGWNLCRFAESLLPLFSDNQNEAVNIAQEAISTYNDIFYNNWMSIMRSKLGLFNEEVLDKAIIEDLLSIMEKYKEDYTNTFVSLTTGKNMDKGMFISEEFKNWYKVWKERLTRQENSSDEINKLIDALYKLNSRDKTILVFLITTLSILDKLEIIDNLLDDVIGSLDTTKSLICPPN